MMLPSCWPSGLQTIEELCLDPVEAAGPWPSFQGQGRRHVFEQSHLRAWQVRAALRVYICGQQGRVWHFRRSHVVFRQLSFNL